MFLQERSQRRGTNNTLHSNPNSDTSYHNNTSHHTNNSSSYSRGFGGYVNNNNTRPASLADSRGDSSSFSLKQPSLVGHQHQHQQQQHIVDDLQHSRNSRSSSTLGGGVGNRSSNFNLSEGPTIYGTRRRPSLGSETSRTEHEEHLFSFWVRSFRYHVGLCFDPSEDTRGVMKRVVESKRWYMFLFFFTLILLFGAQIQDLVIPKEGDVVFDVLFTLAFGFLCCDIILKSFVWPNYCSVHCCSRSYRMDGRKGKAGGCCGVCSCFGIGSFLFWCDVLSTLSLLFDISYINSERRSMQTQDVHVGVLGIPDGSSDETPAYVLFNINIFVSIARTLRVGRFIVPSVALSATSRINWYWISEKFNPYFYLKLQCIKNLWIAKVIRNRISMIKKGTFQKKPTVLTPPELKKSSSDMDDSVTGSTLGDTDGRSSQARKRMSGILQPVLSPLGLQRQENDSERREKRRRRRAARKIQAAWRKYQERTNPPTDQPSLRGSMSSIGSRSATSYNRKSSIIPSSMKQSLRRSSTIVTTSRRQSESQVGNAMRELTGQRVATGMVGALLLTAMFSLRVGDGSASSAMILLHSQTQNTKFRSMAIEAARSTAIPELYQYTDVFGNISAYQVDCVSHPDNLREREKKRITVFGDVNTGLQSEGLFCIRKQVRDTSFTNLLITFFVLIVWLLGVTAFAGPVMTLVVLPIERMVRLLMMLMRDPLGYQSSPKYKKFIVEEESLTKHTMWTKEILEGMETSFLMSTILRIGSLMKVGFGSAGVEVIRKNLEKGQKKDVQFMNTKGSTVSCIFLFCDIRQFTDATECLQEQVFVFTNRIAAVVHSYCHAYGGSANKNMGDAFLVSWLLDTHRAEVEDDIQPEMSFLEWVGTGGRKPPRHSTAHAPDPANDELYAYNNQADKCLLSVVKVCIALHHDKFYLDSLSENAKARLLKKLKKRPGPVVQMGFGLHAGKAVQGAIGSERKIDATYVSEAVERTEFLESSTKEFGLHMLMSDSFHSLLHPSNKRRCRKVDQIVIRDEENDDVSETEDFLDASNVMELFTFDMDIDALWRSSPLTASSPQNPHAGSLDITEGSFHGALGSGLSDHDGTNFRSSHTSDSLGASKRDIMKKPRRGSNMGGGDGLSMSKSGRGTRRRVSLRSGLSTSSHGPHSETVKDRVGPLGGGGSGHTFIEMSTSVDKDDEDGGSMDQMPELVLPSGPLPYIPTIWFDKDMRKIRQRYSDNLFPFFQKFNAGLQSYYSRDWEHARQCFDTILDHFEDGPSKYFLNKIKENNGVPPRNFTGYSVK